MRIKLGQTERCQRCILPTSLPSVKLDKTGICNHCRDYEKILVNWQKTKETRSRELHEIFANAKKKNRRYDVLIPLSGGKDSVYSLYACSKIFGMKCLAITFDNGYVSQHAKDNIVRSVDACDADHMTFRISRPTQLMLYRTYLARCGSFCAACMRGIGESIEIPCRTFNIPLVVLGGGSRVIYLSMLKELFQGGDTWVFSKVAVSNPAIKEAARLGAASRYARLPNLYFLVERKLRHLRGPKVINIYDYMDVVRTEVLNIIKQEIGWQQARDEFEHTDCLLHQLVGYIHALRFPELSHHTVYYSGQIRFGELTREEALKLEEEFLKNSQVPKEIDEFIKDIGISREEFERYASDWRSIEKFR